MIIKIKIDDDSSLSFDTNDLPKKTDFNTVLQILIDSNLPSNTLYKIAYAYKSEYLYCKRILDIINDPENVDLFYVALDMFHNVDSGSRVGCYKDSGSRDKCYKDSSSRDNRDIDNRDSCFKSINNCRDDYRDNRDINYNVVNNIYKDDDNCKNNNIYRDNNIYKDNNIYRDNNIYKDNVNRDIKFRDTKSYYILRGYQLMKRGEYIESARMFQKGMYKLGIELCNFYMTSKGRFYNNSGDNISMGGDNISMGGGENISMGGGSTLGEDNTFNIDGNYSSNIDSNYVYTNELLRAISIFNNKDVKQFDIAKEMFKRQVPRRFYDIVFSDRRDFCGVDDCESVEAHEGGVEGEDDGRRSIEGEDGCESIEIHEGGVDYEETDEGAHKETDNGAHKETDNGAHKETDNKEFKEHHSNIHQNNSNSLTTKINSLIDTKLKTKNINDLKEMENDMAYYLIGKHEHIKGNLAEASKWYKKALSVRYNIYADYNLKRINVDELKCKDNACGSVSSGDTNQLLNNQSNTNQSNTNQLNNQLPNNQRIFTNNLLKKDYDIEEFNNFKYYILNTFIPDNIKINEDIKNFININNGIKNNMESFINKYKNLINNKYVSRDIIENNLVYFVYKNVEYKEILKYVFNCGYVLNGYVDGCGYVDGDDGEVSCGDIVCGDDGDVYEVNREKSINDKIYNKSMKHSVDNRINTYATTGNNTNTVTNTLHGTSSINTLHGTSKHNNTVTNALYGTSTTNTLHNTVTNTLHNRLHTYINSINKLKKILNTIDTKHKPFINHNLFYLTTNSKYYNPTNKYSKQLNDFLQTRTLYPCPLYTKLINAKTLTDYKECLDSVYGANGIGICLSKLGRYEDSLKVFYSVVIEYSCAQINIGNVYCIKGEYEKACQSYLSVEGDCLDGEEDFDERCKVDGMDVKCNVDDIDVKCNVDEGRNVDDMDEGRNVDDIALDGIDAGDVKSNKNEKDSDNENNNITNILNNNITNLSNINDLKDYLKKQSINKTQYIKTILTLIYKKITNTSLLIKVYDKYKIKEMKPYIYKLLILNNKLNEAIKYEVDDSNLKQLYDDKVRENIEIINENKRRYEELEIYKRNKNC